MNTETVVLRNCPEQLRDGNKVIVDKAYLREQQLTTEIFPHPTLKANPLLAPRYPLIDPLTAEDGAKGKCQQREWSQLLSSGHHPLTIPPAKQWPASHLASAQPVETRQMVAPGSEAEYPWLIFENGARKAARPTISYAQSEADHLMSTLAFRKGLGAISSATSSYLIQNVKNPLLIEVGGRASGTPAAVPGTVGGLAQFPAIAALVEQEERMYHSPEKSTVLSDARAYRPRTVHNDGRQLKDPTAFASKHIMMNHSSHWSSDGMPSKLGHIGKRDELWSVANESNALPASPTPTLRSQKPYVTQSTKAPEWERAFGNHKKRVAQARSNGKVKVEPNEQVEKVRADLQRKRLQQKRILLQQHQEKFEQLMAKLEGKSAVVSERLHPGLMDAWEEKKTELLKQRQQLQMKVAQEAMIAHQKIKSASSKTKAMIKAKSDLNAEAELRRKLDSRKLRKECAEQQRKQSILEFRERLANASPKTKSIPTGKDLREKIQSQAEYAQKKAAGLREKQSREVQAELRRRWLKKQFMERRRAAAEAKEPTPSFIHK